MKILLTGAFGNVGSSTLEELLKKGQDVRVFELDTPKNKRRAKKYPKVEFVWGNITQKQDLEKVVSNVDAIIHTAAIIPPLADQKPEFAYNVNVNGTENLIKAIQEQSSHARIIYTSSISIYGDRLRNPLIKTTDLPHPNKGDSYAEQKLHAEELIKNSGLPWTIFRLTYVASPNKLKMDPLMFDMPLETSLEIGHTSDIGLALATAIDKSEMREKTFDLAGGEECRTTYREYLNNMFKRFGFGRNFLPEKAFAKKGFHCGFLDTFKSQQILQYQKHTLAEYYKEIKEKVKNKRFFLRCVKQIVRTYLIGKSPYY